MSEWAETLEENIDLNLEPYVEGPVQSPPTSVYTSRGNIGPRVHICFLLSPLARVMSWIG